MLAQQLGLAIDENTLTDNELLVKLLESYDQKQIASFLNAVSPDKWCRETINRWVKGKASPVLSYREFLALETLLPKEVVAPEDSQFKFIDLFAGIGGIRKGFEEQGGLCVFTSEWNKQALRTYKANYYSDPTYHRFNEDIRDVTLSQNDEISEQEAYAHINQAVPDHDILLAGFPCQPFSIAGVSKKNSLGRAHGFECDTQGTLFFDVARIIHAKQPKAFVLENVKNLKSHDKGNTFKVIMKTLEELGYWVSDVEYEGGQDPKIIDAQHWVPQHRERIILVGFRKDLDIHHGFSLKLIQDFFPKEKPQLSDVLDETVDEKYTLTEHLWTYLYHYAEKHRAKGNGFGFGLVEMHSIARTLSARYYKDGSEILINQGWDLNKPFTENSMKNRPRRLTPVECARLMGFTEKGQDDFRIPVSDTQAYQQFGNSVVVPVFRHIAKLVVPRVIQA